MNTENRNLQTTLCFEVLSTLEAKYRIENIPLWKNELGKNAYSGFHFFSPLDFSCSDELCEEQFFIMAFDKEELVGVLLLILENPKTHHYGISFVDVHVYRRREGIATQLYKKLNDWVKPYYFLSLSSLTDAGKKAKLNVIFRREINRCTIIN